MLMHGLKASGDHSKIPKINQRILQKLDSLFLRASDNNDSESSSSSNISYLSNKLSRVNILDFIRAVRLLKSDYLSFFMKWSKKYKENGYRMKIHGFSSLCSSILDLEIEERNINCLFLTIDKDKNGHIDENEFVNIVENMKPDGTIRNK